MSDDISIYDTALDSGPIYEDASYKYFGEAHPGTALNSPHWRVNRMRKTDFYVEWLDEGNFSQVYTDLATVAALF